MLGSGAQTGFQTPRSQASFRPLVLSHGSLEHTFHISSELHFTATRLKDAFVATLPASTEELAQDDEPSSTAELIARYLGYVAKETEDDADDASSLGTLSAVLLTEFE